MNDQLEKNMDPLVSEYLEENFRLCLLTNGNKRPLSDEQGQIEITNYTQYINLSMNNNITGVGIYSDSYPCGQLICIDVDVKKNGNGFDYLNSIGLDLDSYETLTEETASGGRHYFFWNTDDELIKDSTNSKIHIDVLAMYRDNAKRKRYVIVTPSIVNGKQYHFINYREDIPIKLQIKKLDETLKNFIFSISNQKKETVSEVVDPVNKMIDYNSNYIPEGGRNDALFNYGIKLRDTLDIYDVQDMYNELAEVNDMLCTPPLSGSEVLSVASSIINGNPNLDYASDMYEDKIMSLIYDSMGDIMTFEDDLVEVLPNFLYEGTITFLASEGGAGKSTYIMEAILEPLTTGGPWMLDNPLAPIRRKPVNVLYLNVEDGNTIRQRKLRRTHVNSEMVIQPNASEREALEHLSLDKLKRWERMIHHYNAKVVIIDPYQYFFPDDKDMNKMQETRKLLTHFQSMITRNKVAALFLGHTRKDKRGFFNADSIIGSSDIKNIGRMVFLMGKTTDGRRYMNLAKQNNELDLISFEFHLDNDTKQLVFDGYTDKTSEAYYEEYKQSIYQMRNDQKQEEKKSNVEIVTDYIQELLILDTHKRGMSTKDIKATMILDERVNKYVSDKSISLSLRKLVEEGIIENSYVGERNLKYYRLCSKSIDDREEEDGGITV